MTKPTDHLVRWYPALLLLALAGLTFWLDQKVQPLPVPRDGSTRHDPDFVVDNFTAMRMNPDGTQRYAIRGSTMIHYPDDGTTQVVRPRFVHYDAKTAPVKVTSDTALLSRDGEDVYFEGNVDIVRDTYADEPEMTLQTEYLHLTPEEDLARTDRKVTMVRGTARVEGVGMLYDHKTRTLELLSQVKVTYGSPTLNLPAFGRK